MKKENIDAIVIHCSATPEGLPITLEDIDRWHRAKGWAMVGYNYVIELDGKIREGRPLTRDGAHCNTSGLSGKAYNKHSIGICYIGGLDRDGNPKDTRTVAQKVALDDLVHELIQEYPIKEVIGHRDASPDKNGNGKIERNEWIKQCPCFDAKAEFPIAVCTAKKK